MTVEQKINAVKALTNKYQEISNNKKIPHKAKADILKSFKGSIQEYFQDINNIENLDEKVKADKLEVKAMMDAAFAEKISFFSKHARALKVSLATLTLGGMITGCSLEHQSKVGTATFKTKEVVPAFDTDLYDRAPLLGDTLVSESTELAKSFAANGAYDKEGYSTDIYNIAAILTTIGANNDKQEFQQQLNLKAHFTSKSDVNKALNQLNELLGKVSKSKGDMDWKKIIPKKSNYKMLERAEGLWNKSSLAPTDAEKSEWNKFIDDVILDVEQYDAFTIMGLDNYITMASIAKLMPTEKANIFNQAIENCCANMTDGKSVCGIGQINGEAGAVNTIYSSARRMAETYAMSLIENSKKHIHTADEKYYSIDEIFNKTKANLKDVKNADIDIEAKGKDVAIGIINEITEARYPGQVVSNDDPNINRNDNTYDTNTRVPGETVGDIKDAPSTDMNGNVVEDIKTVEQLIQQGYNDYYSGLAPQSTDVNYMNAYNTAKKTADEVFNNMGPEKEDITTKEEYNDVVVPPVQAPTNQIIQETPAPPANIQSETITEDITISDEFKDYIVNEDGTLSKPEIGRSR